MSSKEEIYACFPDNNSLATWARDKGFSPVTVYNHIARYSGIVSWPRSKRALAVEAAFYRDFGMTICNQNEKLMKMIAEAEAQAEQET